MPGGFSGDLLGSPVAPETYEIDLLSFMIGADSYDIDSPQLGRLTVGAGKRDLGRRHCQIGARAP